MKLAQFLQILSGLYGLWLSLVGPSSLLQIEHDGFLLCLKTTQISQAVMEHAFKASTQEAYSRRSLGV